MFTGIIVEVGKVKGFVRKGGFARLKIACDKVKEGVNVGDSIAVNGVCLSVTDKNGDIFFDVVENTVKTTDLKRLKVGDTVNLENALRLGDTVSGHMVSGHIDGERKIKNNKMTSKGWVLDIGTLPGDEKYLVPKGSVAIDGVSLTVGEAARGMFRIFLIPHTLKNTTLELKKTGDYVNVEFDMMAKYAERGKSKGSVSEGMLRRNGFV